MSAASGGLIDPDSVGDGVALAAVWLAGERAPPRPIMPSLRRRFNLSTAEAVLRSVQRP